MSRFLIHVPAEQVLALATRFDPSEPRMEAVGFFIRQQVADRFLSQGASGGEPWPAKRVKTWGYDDGRSILTGRSAGLAESFQSYGLTNSTGVGEAVVFSDKHYARVHQLGTVGKGGRMPDIRPKRAKALFIPITDRAASSQRYEGAPAAFFRRSYGGGERMTPIRVATRGPKLRGSDLFRPLVKGRLKDGRLQKWDARNEEWIDGTPDFIFLQKVSIPRRPMLPDGAAEQAAQDQFVAEVMANAE